MTGSIHDAYVSEGAKQILDIWEANRAAGKYQLNRVKQQGPDRDVLQKSSENTDTNAKDGKNDGKISFKDKLANFGKGLASPINTMLSSPTNFMLTVGSVVAGAGIIALTGGAAAPVFVAAGILGGGATILNGIYMQSEAKTDDEAKQAWQEMGSGTFTAGLSVLGSKYAVKEAGIASAENRYAATLNCFKTLPENFGKTLSTLVTKFITGEPVQAGRQAASEASASTGVLTKVKNFFGNLKEKIFPSKNTNASSSEQTSAVQANKTNQNDVIRVSENDIEIIPPDARKPVKHNNNINSEIIDAEYTILPPPPKQLPPPSSS